MNETIYIKRSVKDSKELPKGEVIAINKYGEKLVGWLSPNGINSSIRCESEESLMDSVTHWLEEMSLEEYLKEIKYEQTKNNTK